MKTRNFRDLQVWQRAMGLARSIYSATEGFPKREEFGLVSQMRRSAISVPSNIAEGRGRLSDKGFAVFLGHARGSLCELRTQIELAGNFGYLTPQAAGVMQREAVEIGRMLNGLLRTLRWKDA